MVDSFIKSSFGLLLKLQEVTRYRGLITMPADIRIDISIGKEQAGFRYGKAGLAVLRRH